MAASKLYAFPQQAPAISSTSGERGIARMSHPDVGSLRFRTAPTEFSWDYTLNKRIENTYGGRVVQLLGAKIDEFQFKADSGGGRWEYSNKVAKFMRDAMIAQRNGRPVTFEYTTRGWKMNLYVVNVPFQDAVEEVRREFTIQCKIQEDISGVMSKNTLSTELRRLQAGVNFRRSKYNDPLSSANALGGDSENTGFAQVQSLINGAQNILESFSPVLNFLPNGVQRGFDIGNLIGGL